MKDELSLAGRDVRRERRQRIRPADGRRGDNRRGPEPLTEAKTSQPKGTCTVSKGPVNQKGTKA